MHELRIEAEDHAHEDKGRDKEDALETERGVFCLVGFSGADILTGDDGTARGKRGENIDKQHVEHIDQCHAGHRCLTDIGHLHGIDHAHEHGKGLFDDERQDQAA